MTSGSTTSPRKLLIPIGVLVVLAIVVGLVAAVAGASHKTAGFIGVAVLAVVAVAVIVRSAMFGRTQRRRLLGRPD